MAERLGRQLYPQHHWESAGVMPTGTMHPMTARVLAERGADNTGFASRHVDDLDLREFDHFVMIGDTAQALAPEPPPGVVTHNWYVDDPYEVIGSAEKIYAAYKACEADLVKRIVELVAEFE